MNCKKRLQKALCIALVVASVFSMITPVSCAGSLNLFKQENGFWGVEVTCDAKNSKHNNVGGDRWNYKDRYVISLLEEKNKEATGAIDLWTKNVPLGFCMHWQAREAGSSQGHHQKSWIVIVPKGVSVFDALAQANPSLRRHLDRCNQIPTRCRCGTEMWTESAMKHVPICANQVLLPQHSIGGGTISTIEIDVIGRHTLTARAVFEAQERATRHASMDRAVQQALTAAQNSITRAITLPKGPYRVFVPKNRLEPGPEYDIVNGLLGMNRDVFLRALKLTKGVAMVRALFGSCQEALLWRSHHFAQKILRVVLPKNTGYESSRRESLYNLYTREFRWLQQAINSKLLRVDSIKRTDFAACQAADDAERACGLENATNTDWQKTIISHVLNMLKSLNATNGAAVSVREQNARAITKWEAGSNKNIESFIEQAQGICENMVGTAVEQKLQQTASDYVYNGTAGVFALNPTICWEKNAYCMHYTNEKLITLLFHILARKHVDEFLKGNAIVILLPKANDE
ncbi:hypothetical protein FACS1894198_4280 [Clostridia bacterium]|nr:hypothetical protein FACS1894198_4280 [Clostridia bacterium]